MCVILVATKTRPTARLLADCEDANRHGGGVAWRERKQVHWIKGKDLTAKDIADITAKIPMPFVVHFRISTVGGVNNELCHPFPVTLDVAHADQGSADAVLFHNGHWGQWQETMIESVCSANLEVPEGPWSDSRAMAFLAARHGMPFVDLIPDSQRVVYLGTRRMVVRGNGWTNINDGLRASNTMWMRTTYRREIAKHVAGDSTAFNEPTWITDGNRASADRVNAIVEQRESAARTFGGAPVRQSAHQPRLKGTGTAGPVRIQTHGKK